MAKKLIIHVGMPRSASSTLQEAMFFHRALLERHGVLYPIIQHDGQDEYNHRALQASAKGLLSPSAGFHAYIAHITTAITASPAEIAILSYEGWWDPRNRRGFRRIVAALRKKLPELQLVIAVVLREPVAFLFSLYKLDVLHGRTSEQFAAYVPRGLSDPRMRYADIVAALESQSDVLRLACFDSLARSGNLCGNALSVLTGMDLATVPALQPLQRHRSGGTAYFSDAVISMMRFAGQSIGQSFVAQHRLHLQAHFLALSREDRFAEACAALVIPLPETLANHIAAVVRPQVEPVYQRFLASRQPQPFQVKASHEQRDIAPDSDLGLTIHRELTVLKRR